MKAAVLLLLALVAPVSASSVSPIGKVIEMISDLQAKIIKEGEEAQKVYEEFAEWCEDRSKQLTFEIKTGKAEVKELKATIAQEESIVESMTAEIEKLSGDLKTDEADLKAATEIREKEAATFAAAEKELMETIDTLQRAISILEREMSKSGASFVQVQNAQNLVQALSVMVSSSMINTADASKLSALVQTSSDDSDAGAPAAAVYEGQSGGIIDTLKDLLDKAETQLEDARKKETQDLHAFEMMKQSLEDEIKFGNKEMSEAKAKMAAAGEKKATAEGDLSITTKDLKSDITALADLHHDCMTKAEEFETETKSRGEELSAIAKAKEIIQETTGGAADQSYSFVQVSSKITSRAGLAQFEAARFVRDLSRKQNSKELALLAARITSVATVGARSGEDIFGKVKDLIRDMVAKLEKEAEEDATEKAFCDKELAETNEKKDDKTSEIEKLTTKIDTMSARSSTLKEEIAALQKELSELTSSQAEMDKLRSEENELYTTNKAEMEKGLEGVKLALKVLKEYYAKDKDHSSADGAGSGIIGMLEVVESDFSKGLAEIIQAEETAVATYEKETKENEIEKTTKEQDVKYKTKESTDLDKAVAEASNDKSGVQEELDAVMKYLKGIEDRCIAKAETFEERAARFKAEIAGLKEALEILNSEAALIQKKSVHSLRGVKKHVQ